MGLFNASTFDPSSLEPRAIVPPANFLLQLNDTVPRLRSAEELGMTTPVVPPATSNTALQVAGALGNIGTSIMGTHKDSWQAQMGNQVAADTKSRIYSKALARAVAGATVGEDELQGLDPSQVQDIHKTAMDVKKSRNDDYMNLARLDLDLQKAGYDEADRKIVRALRLAELRQTKEIAQAQITSSETVADKNNAARKYDTDKQYAAQMSQVGVAQARLNAELAKNEPALAAFKAGIDYVSTMDPMTDPITRYQEMLRVAKQQYEADTAWSSTHPVDWASYAATGTSSTASNDLIYRNGKYYDKSGKEVAPAETRKAKSVSVPSPSAGDYIRTGLSTFTPSSAHSVIFQPTVPLLKASGRAAVKAMKLYKGAFESPVEENK